MGRIRRQEGAESSYPSYTISAPRTLCVPDFSSCVSKNKKDNIETPLTNLYGTNPQHAVTHRASSPLCPRSSRMPTAASVAREAKSTDDWCASSLDTSGRQDPGLNHPGAIVKWS